MKTTPWRPLKGKLLSTAARCVSGGKVTKREAATLLKRARDLIEELELEIASLTQCPKCSGLGRRWYSLYGEGSCDECKGTGERQ